MFIRLTARAEYVVVVEARREADLLGYAQIGDEHILLGLLRDRESVAARVLESLGVTLGGAREQVKGISRPGNETDEDSRPFRIDFHVALKNSQTEAANERCDVVDTEHILLGLTSGKPEKALVVLGRMGVTREQVRNAVLKELVDKPDFSERTTRKPTPAWDIEYLNVLAARIAEQQFGSEYYNVSHLVLALLEHAQELGVSSSLERLFTPTDTDRMLHRSRQ